MHLQIKILKLGHLSTKNKDLCRPATSECIVQQRETSPPCLVCRGVSVCDNVHNSCNNFNISKTLSTSGGWWWPGLVAAGGRTLLGSLFKDTPPPPHYLTTLPHLAWSSISNLQGRPLVTKFTNLWYFFIISCVSATIIGSHGHPQKIVFLFVQCHRWIFFQKILIFPNFCNNAFYFKILYISSYFL